MIRCRSAGISYFLMPWISIFVKTKILIQKLGTSVIASSISHLNLFSFRDRRAKHATLRENRNHNLVVFFSTACLLSFRLRFIYRPDKEFFFSTPDCTNALGMEAGLIKDVQITASSIKTEFAKAAFARLNNKADVARWALTVKRLGKAFTCLSRSVYRDHMETTIAFLDFMSFLLTSNCDHRKSRTVSAGIIIDQTKARLRFCLIF